MTFRFCLLVAPLLLAGCVRNTVVVVAPRPAIPTPSPCRPPPGTPPIEPVRAPNPHMFAELPPQARQARVAGCAGILFRVAPDGRATDARVAAEAPSGYGFGAAALTALQGDVFHPAPGDQAWHYVISTMSGGR